MADRATTPARPRRRVLRMLRAVVAVVLGALVWSAVVAVGTAAVIITDAAAAAPVHPIVRLAHTRTDCRLVGVDQAGEVTRLRVVGLSERALRCVLDGMGAPGRVWPEVAKLHLMCNGRCETKWSNGTVHAVWFQHPTRELDLTIRVVVDSALVLPAGGGSRG